MKMKNISKNEDIAQEIEDLTQSIEDFNRIYKNKIEIFTKKIFRQFRSLVKGDNLSIEVVPFGTSITIEEYGGVNNNNDDYNSEDKNNIINVTLKIGYHEMILAMKNTELDIFEIFCKLVTHEYLHVLCGHFDKNITDEIVRFVHRGNIKGYYENNINGLRRAFIVEDTKSYKINKDLSHEILNVAGDFEINNLINFPGDPFLRAKDFNLPEGLSTLEYYAILYYTLISFPKDEIKFGNFSSTGEQNFIANYFIAARSKIKELFINEFINSDDSCENNPIIDRNIFEPLKYKYFNEEKMEKERKDSSFGKDFQGNLPDYAHKMSFSQSGIWKEFNDIINDISASSEMKLSFVDRYDSWTKFNNRKSGVGDLLYPGKREKMGSIERKIDFSYVLFVDVSGSMSSVIDPLFTFCYYALERLNITLVFYDTSIVHIYNKGSEIKLEAFVAGGTDAYAAVREYEEKFKKPTKVFILSDCEDNTLINIKRNYDCKIWCVNGVHIKPFDSN